MVEHKSNESYLLYKRSLTESSGAQNVIKLDTQTVGNDIILSDSDNINWKMVIMSSRNFNLQVLAIITEVIKGCVCYALALAFGIVLHITDTLLSRGTG